MTGYVLIRDYLDGSAPGLIETLPFRLLRSYRAAEKQAREEIQRNDHHIAVTVLRYCPNGRLIEEGRMKPTTLTLQMKDIRE